MQSKSRWPTSAPGGPGRASRARLADLPPWAARLVLALAAVLALATIGGPAGPPAATSGPEAHYTDRELYREITARVGAGQDYYAAAAAAQRAHGYPTAPAWAFREPTEAWLLAALRGDLLRWGALLALAAASVVAMRAAVDQIAGARPLRIAVALMFGFGLAIVGVPTAPWLHENWAAVLIGLSLACWRAQGRGWAASAALGLTACLFRELAAPYLVVMAAFAALEGRRAEALGWTAALLVLAGALGVHFALAARQHLPADGASQGWVRFGGWPFAVLAARRSLLLALLPAPLASLALTASLLGLVSARSPWLDRVAATLAAFLAIFTVVGRPDNYYWGMLIAPLAGMGLAFAPAALADLVRAAGRRAAAPSRQTSSEASPS
jgi:hypothetical protein